MTEKPFNENRLSEKLHEWIENSHADRVIDDGSEEIDAWAADVAAVLFRGASDAVSDQSVRQAQSRLEEVFGLPEGDRRRRFAGLAIDNRLGEETVRMQATAERRFLSLVLMGKEAITDERTKPYLQLATQCYLFGFDEQCVIMCRSALEAAFMEVVPKELCVKLQKQLRPGKTWVEYNLKYRIDAADASKAIDQHWIDVASLVNEAAKDVIHPDRGKAANIEPEKTGAVLFGTIHVVQALMKGAKPRSKSE